MRTVRREESYKIHPTEDIATTSEDDSLQVARSVLQRTQKGPLQDLHVQVGEVAHTSTFDGRNQ